MRRLHTPVTSIWVRRPKSACISTARRQVGLSTVVYLILVGLPGFEGTLAIANWMFGLLFIYHIISNNRRLQRALAVKKRQNRDGSKEEKIRAALKAGEE